MDHFEHLRSALLESIASKSTMRAAFLFGTQLTPVWRINKTSESQAPNKNKKNVYIYIPSWTHESSSGFSWWCNLQEFWIVGSTILMANLGDLLMSFGSRLHDIPVSSQKAEHPARCPLPSTSILSKIFCKSFLGYNLTGSLQPFNKANWHQQTECLSPAPYHYIECDGYHYELIPCQIQLSIVMEPENHPWEKTTQQKCNLSKQMAQYHTAVYYSKGLGRHIRDGGWTAHLKTISQIGSFLQVRVKIKMKPWPPLDTVPNGLNVESLLLLDPSIAIIYFHPLWQHACKISECLVRKNVVIQFVGQILYISLPGCPQQTSLKPQFKLPKE